MRCLAALIIVAFALAEPPLRAASGLPDIASIEPDLTAPPMTDATPAAGQRVRYHALYLPANWKPGAKFPVLVEFQGNGGYRDYFGDACDGLIESCKLGFGISAGVDYIWISMPFVNVIDGWKENQPLWWGDPDETAAYCVATVREVCRELGGDERAVVLCGFSRGSIAGNYIGLRNDTIASLWRAFICHSHYDGVRTTWPYRDADRVSALARLQRLKGRPQFISQEISVEPTRKYLEESGETGDLTFVDFPFRNHTDLWALRDCELRRRVRDWLREHGLPAPD